MDYLEIAPGIAIVGKKLNFCPGCGMEEVGGDPNDPEDVRAWFLAVYAAVTSGGAVGYTPEKAIRDADAYIREPWHLGGGEKGGANHAR